MKHTKIKSMNDEKKYDEALRLLIEYTCTVNTKKRGGGHQLQGHTLIYSMSKILRRDTVLQLSGKSKENEK